MRTLRVKLTTTPSKTSLGETERDACGGCFSKIPPQRQLDVKAHKKIIVCEHCGRILIDDNLFAEEQV